MRIGAETGRIRGILAATALAMAGGCDPASEEPVYSTSTEKAAVRGTVTLDGRALAGGKITFDAANIGRTTVLPAVTTIGPDGHYEVETYVGTNVVGVEGPGLGRGFGTKAEVKRGGTTFDIAIPKP